jgi:DNA replication protein DnaC
MMTDSSMFDFPQIDFCESAVACSQCGKPLQANAIRYINGLAFCNSVCEKIANNKAKYGSKISEILEANTKPLYRNSDIELLKQNLTHPERIEQVLNWSMTENSPNGLIIYGESGAGKTRALTLLLKKLITQDLVGVSEHSLKVFYAGELERAIMSSFGEIKNYDKLIANLSNVGLLVIDDFGKEKFTERYEVAIFSIFENRISNLKPTIFTTNFVGKSFQDRFTSSEQFLPFYRRIKEFNTAINFKRKEK